MQPSSPKHATNNKGPFGAISSNTQPYFFQLSENFDDYNRELVVEIWKLSCPFSWNELHLNEALAVIGALRRVYNYFTAKLQEIRGVLISDALKMGASP